MRPVITFGLLLSALAGCGADTHDHPVRAELVASVDSVRPGQPIMVGVLLAMQPNWHVYWKYSGDAGLPTEIKWQLPEGWMVGGIQWPRPEKFIENGPLTTYGYTDSVLLAVQVIPPASLPTGSTVSIGAQADWMVCHDECVPGKAKLDLKLAVISDESPGPSAVAEQFEAWAARLPEPSETAGWEAQTQAVLDSGTGGLDVTLRLSHPEVASDQVLSWFPAPSPDLLVKDIRVSSEAGVTVVSLALKSMFGAVPAGEAFESLLIYRDRLGREKGVTFLTPLAVEPAS